MCLKILKNNFIKLKRMGLNEMKIMWKKHTKLSLALAVCFTPALAHATNGLFMIGYGNKSRAMGGVSIATPLDTLSAASNPATISGMGDQFDIGMDIFVAEVEAQLGSVTAESEASINGLGLENTFFMPALGITYQYSDDITLGFSMVPVGGGGTLFRTNFFNAAAAGTTNVSNINDKLGVDLSIAEMNTTIAYKINENNHVGASFVVGIARFNAYGLGLFDNFTQTQGSTDNFTNQGKDWTGGVGMQFGWMGTYDNLTLGAEYTSKVYMDEFDRYTELFAESGKFDIPASVGLGISYKVMPELLVALDVTYTFYEDVKAVSNLGPNLAGDPTGPLGPPAEGRRLGLDNGLGFGWTNQTVFKLGLQYDLSQSFILRAGWNYGESPINESREIIFNLLAPATAENHLTLGGTYIIDEDMELNFSYVHAFENEQFGPTYISDDGSNFGRIKMTQNSVGGSLSWKF
ncbi:putative facilitator of salicylate uptake [hydrothermal vent metagenome]|uniref:Putative facilitator of salicylate uptake n=1 Tax=hydrothermal vent metagenome TaxID=652676 RepID=A0A3B0X2P1_9ZZZZ